MIIIVVGISSLNLTDLWLSKEECGKVVEEAWNGAYEGDVVQRIECVAQKLSQWATSTFGVFRKKKKEALDRLNLMQQCVPDVSTIEQCNAFARELDEIHKLEEYYWHAISRVNEIRDGGKNTKYFDHKASQIKERSAI